VKRLSVRADRSKERCTWQPSRTAPTEQVARLGAALDRPLTFEPFPDDAWKQLPPEYAEASFDIFRDHPELESEVQPKVEKLLGRSLGRLEDWLIRHREKL
jgi:hypothetical protein